MKSEPQSSKKSSSTQISDDNIIKQFFQILSIYQIHGMPEYICVNKSIFDIVVDYMIRENKWASITEEEYKSITYQGIKFDVANINSPEWMVGIYADGRVEKIRINLLYE